MKFEIKAVVGKFVEFLADFGCLLAEI
jgi:hypothetical protein